MKRLYRDRSDQMIAGVCSGIAEYLDVDPTAIRLAFVLLLFLGGGGFWIYLVLWVIMPVKDDVGREMIEVKGESNKSAPKKVAAPTKPAASGTLAKTDASKKTATAKKTVSKTTAAKKTPVKKAPAKTATAKKPAAKTRTEKPPATPSE